MGRRARVLALLVIGVGLRPTPSIAGDSTSVAPPWGQGMSVSGLVTASYGYNFNRPRSATNQLRVFDFDDDTFKLDQLELVAQRRVSKSHDSGFRVDLGFGGSVPRVTAAADPSRAGSAPADMDLHQAFVSYVAPAGSGLRVDVGKFVTHHGYEVIDGPDGWNDNATRSLLFGFAIPFTHVGIRESYTFSPRVAATLMFVNGWDASRDNNRVKSVGGQLALSPLTGVSLTLNGMVGVERTGSDTGTRSLLDVVATWRPCRALSLGANGDWGSEQGAVSTTSTADWDGAAGYLRLASSGGFALSARAERFEDFDAARTGMSQRLEELTLTPEQRLTPHMLLRADLRADRSNRHVFETRTGLTRTQPTVLVSALYSF